MTDDAALFAAAPARPCDETPRLVLADWFDDYGEEELAWALRTVPGIIPFLHDLTRWDRLPATEVQEFRDRAFVNRWETQYWAALLVRYRDQFPEPPGVPEGYDPDAGWTTQPPEFVVTPARFLRAWQDARRRVIIRLREEASDRSDGWRSGPIALPTGDDPRSVETRALLLHELVIRGCGPRVFPGGEEAWDALAAARHPFSRLPDQILELETVHLRALTDNLPAWPAPQGLPNRPGPGFAAMITATQAPPSDGPAFAAVRRWVAESNGRLEARVFGLAVPFTAADEWDGWYRALPFEPLRTGSSTGSVSRTTAAAAFLHLFWADRHGGAYSGRAGTAYSRLHAWETLGWLAGAEPDAPIPAVAELARRCRWYTFDGDWFFHIAWDLGLVCVRPDGHSAAALAATDTD